MGFRSFMTRLGGTPATVSPEEEAAIAKLKAELEKLGEPTAYTRDTPMLERRQAWYIFVPDEMMSKHYDHNRLGVGALTICEGLTQEPLSLWKEKLGKKSKIFLLRDSYGEDTSWRLDAETASPVRGELCLIRASTFFKLDTYRENGVRFDRVRIPIDCPYTEATYKKGEHGVYLDHLERKVRTVKAWAYIGRAEYWDDKLDGGHSYAPVRRFKPHNPDLLPYFFHTPGEYDDT